MLVDHTVRTITFGRPARLLSLNDRTHYHARAKLAKKWRRAAAQAARDDVGHPIGPTVVHITLPVLGAHARDPHNYFATVKPIVDGLVDAELWPDDTPTWVTTVEPALLVHRTRGAYAIAPVIVTLTPRTEQLL